MGRLLSSSKWMAVIIACAVALIATAFDTVSAEQCLEFVGVLVLAGIGGTALEDAIAKARGTFKVPKK